MSICLGCIYILRGWAWAQCTRVNVRGGVSLKKGCAQCFNATGAALADQDGNEVSNESVSAHAEVQTSEAKSTIPHCCNVSRSSALSSQLCPSGIVILPGTTPHHAVAFRVVRRAWLPTCCICWGVTLGCNCRIQAPRVTPQRPGLSAGLLRHFALPRLMDRVTPCRGCCWGWPSTCGWDHRRQGLHACNGAIRNSIWEREVCENTMNREYPYRCTRAVSHGGHNAVVGSQCEITLAARNA